MNIEFEIDDDISLPLYHRYPFAKMDVGDSFLIPKPFPLHRHEWAVQLSVMSCAKRFSEKYHKGRRSFVSKRLDEGVRIWRKT